ncbi:MAG: flagellar hook-basal body protein [Oscillospiraceae bacterium]|jgi:flagellar basal-body rod protein FlgG|nr:flagellar hook-basal body protein [Oscillospiraceae bacterium]
MYEAVMIAATGLTNQQRRLDTIADNIANTNTVGFRASRLDFKEALYTAGIVPAAPRTPEGNQQKGHGVATAAITRERRQGSFTETGGQFDFAIEGEGYFELTDPDGEKFYTRGGNFYITDIEGQLRMVNSDGYFVSDADGNAITVPFGTQAVAAAEDGTLSFQAEDGQVYGDTARLGVFSFRNVLGLDSVGGGNYVETDISDEMFAVDGARVLQGSLENSNVDMAREMTLMIRSQRAFSLASRALRTADDMEQLANNLRR